MKMFKFNNPNKKDLGNGGQAGESGDMIIIIKEGTPGMII